MFLRVRARTPETWMLIDPQRFSDTSFRCYKLSDFVGRGFRTATATEVESRDSKSSSGVTHHLFTPVTLNPLLSCQHQFDFSRLTNGTCLFSATLRSVTNVAQHDTFRDIHLTDPPCNYASAVLTFDARTPSRWLQSVTCHTVIRSDKPLTLGAVIDGTLASNT